MYGGLARRPEITPEGFVLVLCHELGHAYGGIPYKRPERKVAAEGQADYSATRVCMESILQPLALEGYQVPATGFMQKICAENTLNAAQYESCQRKLTAGQSVGTLLAKLSSESAPNYETPDKTMVTTTVLAYPATTQCRADSFFRGALKKQRPRCWYKPE